MAAHSALAAAQSQSVRRQGLRTRLMVPSVLSVLLRDGSTRVSA